MRHTVPYYLCRKKEEIEGWYGRLEVSMRTGHKLINVLLLTNRDNEKGS
jgi:hypothetical protein